MKRPQVVAGAIVFGAGLAALTGASQPLTDYAYAILWWGLLPIADAWNESRRGLSLWRGRSGHFLSITIPVSVLFWLLFEVLNLAAPQWRYRGGIENIYAQTLFGFISFATVIPIMVESYWMVGGEFCLPERFAAFFRAWRFSSILLGLILASIPFVNHVFWFNQGIWLAPAFVLLPFTAAKPCGSAGRFARALVFSGLLAGFFWELLNYWSRTQWEYLILPSAPHLFQMPLPGYLGFIPFALTALVVYLLQLSIAPRPITTVVLYGTALGVLYALTEVYRHRGLWAHV